MSIKTHVAFATGQGIATVLPAVRTILTHDHAARVLLFHGADTLSGVDTLEELQALKNRHLHQLSLHFFFTGEAQDVPLFNGALDADKVRELARTFFDPLQVHEFLLGGPEPALMSISDVLTGLGVEPLRIRGTKESVALVAPAATSSGPAPAGAQAPVSERQTEVTILMDGRRRSFVMNRDSGETVLDAAEQHGFDLPFSCRAGVCSTCRTRVVRGAVEMTRNYALEPWETEQGYVLACQSHPTTDELELDYDDK